MTFSETLVFYLVIGLGVAAAQWSAGRVESHAGRVDYRAGRVESPFGRKLAALAAIPFWPLFLPLLLSGDRRPAEPAGIPAPPDDALARAVNQVETELQAGLANLAGQRIAATSLPDRRLAELHEALVGQADRIRRMDEVLARSAPEEAPPANAPAVTPETERDQASRAARRANLRQLAELRQGAEIELRTNLDRIRELVSQVHLVEFSGAPPGRVEELLAEIAAVVEKMAPRS